MRARRVLEKYVRMVKDMYEDVSTIVRRSVVDTEKFPAKLGLHLGSALSLYVLGMVLDIVTQDVRDASPCTMMFADDVLLCRTSREVVETKFEEWKRVLEKRELKVIWSKT